jgi:hypothetical protein
MPGLLQRLGIAKGVGICTDIERMDSNLGSVTEVNSMTDSGVRNMPADVAAIADCGYAIWARDDVDPKLRARFDANRIPVAGVRHVRIWGLQVDDERELPGLERTQIPDEEVWEVNLEALDGSKFEVDSRLLTAAR